MSQRWLGSPRTHLIAILLAYALLAARVQVHCADLLTSDGQCYLRMAVYYADGDLPHAIFGHWSPLGAWLTVPLVMAGMVPRYAFRLMIGLWGGLAVFGSWRLAGRLRSGPWLRAAATACAALLAAEFSAEHRVDLLLAALLLLYLDAALDERLLESWRRPFAAGALGGAAYLAKLYALPFFVAHVTLVVLVRWWCAAEAATLRRAARAWALGMGGFALVAAPWAIVLSVKLGHVTFGTAAAASYALVGPDSGESRRQAIAGLRAPPRDAYSVWQDATQEPARPRTGAPSPLSSAEVLARQLRIAGRNSGRILGHLAGLDPLHLGIVALAILPLALLIVGRRGEAFPRYAVLLLAVLVFCGGYAFIQAENRRYFWFVFFVLTVLAFHFVGLIPAVLARLTPGVAERERRLAMAAAGCVLAVSLAWRPVRFVRELLAAPPLGRHHRLVAEQLAHWGVHGPLASVGERGWWDGLHTAYYLGAQYAGTPQSDELPGLRAEMRAANTATLLVWGQPRRVRRLLEGAAFERVGAIQAASLPGLRQDVSVLRLRPRGNKVEGEGR